MLIRIASRSSFLAKWQAYQVGSQLTISNPNLVIEYQFRESLGDKNLTDPLWKMPEKGVFTEDFYADLIENKTDVVVHSWKDLPTEEKEKTFIAATLARADQRDLLLFKKSSLNKKELNIFSSSPRRIHHVEESLKWSLPFKTDQVFFINVRGNIQTRINKLLENEEIDGLIVAKAAIDRLMDHSFYKDSDFLNLQANLSKQLKSLNFQILPLSENPTAAAQGALAIEILKSRTDLLDLLNKINVAADFNNCNYERAQLAQFGGGCHQKIGLSCITVNQQQVFFASGIKENNEPIHCKGLLNPRIFNFSASEIITSTELWAKTSRKKNSITQILENKSVLITKKECLHSINLINCFNYTSGIETWKHLAKKGVWVHGSTDSLGEEQLPEVVNWIKVMLSLSDKNWFKLTHQDSPKETSILAPVNIGTYRLEYEPKLDFKVKNIKMIYWKSGYEFLKAIEIWPELKQVDHACGLGQTSKTICSQVPQNKVTIYYDEKNWRSSVLSAI